MPGVCLVSWSQLLLPPSSSVQASTDFGGKSKTLRDELIKRNEINVFSITFPVYNISL